MEKVQLVSSAQARAGGGPGAKAELFSGRGLDRALAPAKSDPEGSPLVAKVVAGIGRQGRLGYSRLRRRRRAA